MVLTGRMTSPNRVSLDQWQSCMTTNSRLGCWYMRTHLLVSLMVLMNDPPWRWIILMGAPSGPSSGQVKGWNCCSMLWPQKPSPIQLTGGSMTMSGSRWR